MPYFFGQGQQQAEQTLAASLERMSEVFRRSLWEDPESPGLSTLQLKLVAYISQLGREASLSEIADDFAMAKSTLSVSLQALDKKELIIKRADPRDRRRSLIVLSPKGERLVTRLASFQEGVLGSIRQIPSGRQQQMLIGMLELLHQFQVAGLISLTGMCHDCHFFDKDRERPFCGLFRKDLAETEIPESWYMPLALT